MSLRGGKQAAVALVVLAAGAIAAPVATAAPKLSIADASAKEQAKPLTFQVSLSKKAKRTVKARYATVDVTAAAGGDYTAASGRVKIAKGKRKATIDVAVLDDSAVEPGETFEVRLSKPRRAKIADGVGVGTIENDDKANDPGPGPDPGTPAISVTDTSPEEGTDAVFTLTLSHATNKQVSVEYSTVDGSAMGDDYAAESGTVTFSPTDVSEVVAVSTEEDNIHEPDETFGIELADPQNATIADSDATAAIADDDLEPTMTIIDASGIEGDPGDATVGAVSLSISLSNPSASQIQIDLAMSDGSAIANTDYEPVVGTFVFTPLAVAGTIDVPIVGDTIDEPDETFTALLSNAVGATIGDGNATGTIVDDDPTVLNETGDAREADFCNLQFPSTTSADPGEELEPIFGRIFEDGLTQPAGAPSGITAEFGIGPDGSNPATDPGWTWTEAEYSSQIANDDEFLAFGVPAPAVEDFYAYTFRFIRADGVTYCDLDGAGSGVGLTFNPSLLGALTVGDP